MALKRMVAAAGALGAFGLLALAGCESSGPKAPTASLARRCADTRFPIYFDEFSDNLTAPARAVIAAEARRAGPCKISSVEVVGLADYKGSATENMELSQRRAAKVAQALADAGLPAPSFDLKAEGSEGAVTASGAKAPMRRRTEVLLHASPA